MHEFASLAAGNLLSPFVLYFALGAAAALVRSDLTIPESISKALALYLMLAIGFKGGASLVGMSAPELAVSILTAIILSAGMPFVAFGLIRSLTSLDVRNAAAVSAHYGSVSIVTFVAATGYLATLAVPFEAQIVVMLAVMETPAIVSGLLLARRATTPGAAAGATPLLSRQVLHEVCFSGGVVLLGGSFLIGSVTGQAGLAMMAPLIEAPFKALLAVFLLDMGLLVGRRLREFAGVGWPVAAFGLYMPLIGGAFGALAGSALGLSTGGLTLLMVLTASASYIVVPAAMRLSLPQANPSIYVTLALGISFPFNLIVGIPVYYRVAQWLARSS